jgi:SAM-dependent methyltransferase/uncharacterized protein YbaR (Trm112 family)
LNVDPWLLEKLACPRDGSALTPGEDGLRCAAGHAFPVVDNVPILLLEEAPETLWVAGASLADARQPTSDPYHIDTLGLSEEERQQLRQMIDRHSGGVDPVVSFLVGATSGIAYRHLIGKLPEYPIPRLRLPAGEGKTLLDVGCSWGRWTIAAGRLGFRPIGIDPSLGAVLAAQRIARQLGVEAHFIVGDARHLPLRPGCIDAAFSYSVLQHFSRDDAARAVGEIGRVLRPGGTSLVQMPTILGLRCLYHQLRRGFREPGGFEVRYWSVPALRRMFTGSIGPSRFSVDCFFGIGLQASDIKLMPLAHRLAIRASEALRQLSRIVPGLYYLADSVYVQSTKAR